MKCCLFSRKLIQYLGGDIRNITILLLLSLLTPSWGQDCEEGYTEIDGECYYQSDLDVLQAFIDNSQAGDNPPPSDLLPIELGEQEWEDGRLMGICSTNNSGEEEGNCSMDYQLSGDIPIEIENLTHLIYLTLDRNQFSGVLPENICSIRISVTFQFIIRNNYNLFIRNIYFLQSNIFGIKLSPPNTHK